MKKSVLPEWKLEQEQLRDLFHRDSSFYREFYFTGYDEAGRGAWAGPVGCAAVSFSFATLERIQKRELLPLLNDSKQMSISLRQEYFEKIKSLADYYAVSLVSERIIDKQGINPSIEKGFLQCYDKCKNEGLELQSGCHFIDGNYKFSSTEWKKFCSESAYCNSFIKGDSRFVCIAAASVLAKVCRDNYLDKLDKQYPVYEWRTNKGYGTRKHRQALGQYGVSKAHRKSYKPVAELLGKK